MRTAQIIDFEAYRSHRREPGRAEPVSAPAISVVWVPIWYWFPLAFFCG